MDDPQVEINTGGGRVHAVAFAANGEYIVSGDERCVRVWRVKDGKEMKTMEAGDVIVCLAVSNDGKWIAAARSFWHRVFLWDATTFETVFDHRESDGIYAVDFSPDSTRLLVASGNTVTVFEVASPAGRVQLGPLHHESRVRAAKYSPTGDRIAAASYNSVQIWDSDDGQLLLQIKVNITPLHKTGLLWGDHNRLFVISNTKMEIIQASTCPRVSEWHVPHALNLSLIALPRHEEFIVCLTDQTVRFWNSWTNTQLACIEQPENICSIALSPDDRFVAIGGDNGKIVVSGLSRFSSHLGYLFQEPNIPIDHDVLDLWKQNRLAEAEASLTAEISTSKNASQHVLACRALVRTRLQEWDAATSDAAKSIGIEPSVVGYIAKSIALVGNGERHEAYRTCDIALQHFHSTHVSFMLLIKAIIVFMAGEYEDAVSRVDDLIAAIPWHSGCYVIQAYMYLLKGNSQAEVDDYEAAIKSFEHAKSRLGNHVGTGHLAAITLIFGWRFDGLAITIQQRLCEALYARNHTKKAGESVLEMINTYDKDVHTDGYLIEWVSGFAHQCLSVPHCGDNAGPEATQVNEAQPSHARLNPIASTMLLREWAKSTLTLRPWRDALVSSGPFVLPRSLVYRAICEHLETSDRIMEASECIHEMANELAEEIIRQDKQIEWKLDFEQRCLSKLMDLGNVALSAERYDDAIAYYSVALTLNPATPQGFLIKRGKAYVAKGSWKEALDDAEKVIVLDTSSPWGYGMKHAALHGTGDYEKAIEAFEEMLSIMLRSPDVETREHHRNYVSPAQTMEMIRRTVLDTIRDSPRVLINTLTGRLCHKTEQAAAFESLPVFKELISSMTTEIDQARVVHAVKEYYRYTTFSHRWEENEPLFEKVTQIMVYDLKKSLAHDKLQMFCKIARDLGFNWAWSDTCCINKADHVVLQEAIVAMFKWYEGSALTIVFLRGVRSPSWRGDLAKSIWNSRAWTFQEYHASKAVKFYTEDWKLYMDLDVPNHKECHEIISEMEEATGISAQALMSLRPGLEDIRAKLSLASQRETTLVEDAAYSLLGIFSVSLPVIYGEGDNALGRLLALLLTSSGDTSILAWTGRSGSFNSCLPGDISVFSKSPTTHIPLVTDADAEIDTTTAGLNSALVMKLYNSLIDLPVPSFAGRRMKLPCLTFKLGPVVSASQSNSEQVFRARTTVLGIVEIRTNENLSKMDSLYLIHPWIDILLDHQPIGSVVETVLEEPEDASDPFSAGGLSSSSGPSNVTRAPKLVSRASQFAARLRLRFTGKSVTRVRSSLRSPSSLSQVDELMRARRAIARLRKPFGALLFMPNPGGGAAYKRVATESLITVRVVEEITPTILNKLIDGVRILDVL